ncbi:MAG: rRNA maturation RNase YbeY [Flavobacteriaceae bacterium]
MQRIEFHYETDFSLEQEPSYKIWLDNVVRSENYTVGSISYIFCDDDYLYNLHKGFLNNDSFTDIITFDYVQGTEVSGDIFISIERVKENAVKFDCSFNEELSRVMAHGLLHLMGYKDKSEEDIKMMRRKEDEKIRLFHVEH